MNCDELISSCEQVRNMAEQIRLEMQRNSLMTKDIDHLFNDLNFSINYCLKYTQQYLFLLSLLIHRKQARIAQSTSSESSSQDSKTVTPTSSMAPEQESRGTIQHGFSNRYVDSSIHSIIHRK